MESETKKEGICIQERSREKKEKWVEQWRKTDGVTKQCMIVSNGDGSQSMTSENSQSYPLISPLSRTTCLCFVLAPPASNINTHSHTYRNTQTAIHSSSLLATSITFTGSRSQISQSVAYTRSR